MARIIKTDVYNIQNNDFVTGTIANRPSSDLEANVDDILAYINNKTIDSVIEPVWGNITGTLSDQTDLQNALDGKADLGSINKFTAERQTVRSDSTNHGWEIEDGSGNRETWLAFHPSSGETRLYTYKGDGTFDSKRLVIKEDGTFQWDGQDVILDSDLGSAAYRDIGTSSGNVMEQTSDGLGGFGYGSDNSTDWSDPKSIDDANVSGFYWGRDSDNANATLGDNPFPNQGGGFGFIVMAESASDRTNQIALNSTSVDGNLALKFRSLIGTNQSVWAEVWHDQNFDPSLKEDKSALGAAAYRDIGTANGDVMEQTSNGLGGFGYGMSGWNLSDPDTIAGLTATGIYTHTGGGAPSDAPMFGQGGLLHIDGWTTGQTNVDVWFLLGSQEPRAFITNTDGSGVRGPDREIYHTGNLNPLEPADVGSMAYEDAGDYATLGSNTFSGSQYIQNSAGLRLDDGAGGDEWRIRTTTTLLRLTAWNGAAGNAWEFDGANSVFTALGSTHLNGEITTSSAALQVNGFSRMGQIYLHEGGPTPTAANKLLRNQSGLLQWDAETLATRNWVNAQNYLVEADLSRSNWDTAYDFRLTNLSINSSTGAITATRGGTSNLSASFTNTNFKASSFRTHNSNYITRITRGETSITARSISNGQTLTEDVTMDGTLATLPAIHSSPVMLANGGSAVLSYERIDSTTVRVHILNVTGSGTSIDAQDIMVIAIGTSSTAAI